MKLLALLLALLSMVAVAAPPEPVKSEYLETTGGGFLIARGERAYYAMNFRIIKELPEEYVLKFSFQNPKRRSPVIEDTRNLKIEGTEIAVQSPILECIKNRKKYEVIVDIYSDKSESEKIGHHQQKIELRVPADVLEQFGVKTC